LIAAAAVVVLIIAVLVAPFLIPVDSYRPLLVWAIEAGTDRQVQIDHLQLFVVPSLRVRIVGFHVQNPPGFPAGDALVAQSIDLAIDPRALLARRLDITDIIPVGVQLNVLRNTTGRSNFAEPVKRTAQGPASVFTLEPLNAVKVNDAQITYADAPGTKRPAPSFTLSGVSGTIGSIKTQASDWAKQLDIVADLRGARLTTSLLNKPIEFRTGALALKGGSGRATFSAAVGTLSLAGSASFPRLDPLSIAFSVSSPELDLATLGTFLGAGAQGGAAGASRYPIAHGTIAIGKVIASPVEVTQLKGQLAFYGSTVQLTACTFSAYGGSVRGSAVIHAATGTPMNATARVAGMNVAQTLAALGWGNGNVTGALDAAFTFATRLTNDPKASLTTTGTFAVRNGSFPGMDFKSSLAQIAKLANINVPSGVTAFSYLGGDLRIAHERGYSNELRLLATGMTGTARGSFGFDQSLNYNGTGVLNVLANGTSSTGSSALAAVAQILHTTLQQDVGAAQVQIPFSLHGTIDNPQFATAGIAQLITNNIPSQVIQQQTGSPAIQSLLKLIPGL
jgi:uncharacterized protein involved in outer membrane biogenesis